MDNITLSKLLADEDKARELLEKQRWNGNPICPHCDAEQAYKITPKEGSKTRKGVYKCRVCRKQFTVTVGTIFEGSRIPISKWLLAIHRICSSKKGISALQLSRELDLTYKSAWFMAHRIRYAMSQEPLNSKLSGTVEVDETYIGGKAKNMHKDAKERALKGKQGGGSHMAPVVTLVEREGRVKTHHMEHVTGLNIKRVLRDHVKADNAFIMTDESTLYTNLDKTYLGHESVNHSEKEWARGIAHINTAESVHAILKRGVIGVYHHWSKKHLHRYLAEFDFRWNHRKISDAERTAKAIEIVGGKRLQYKDPKKA